MTQPMTPTDTVVSEATDTKHVKAMIEDGGDVTLAEQVARMREALEAAEARIAELEAGLAFYASKANYADVPLQQWFRENEGKDAPTGYRCGNIDISAKPGHAIAPIFADLGDLARRLTHQEKNNGR